MKTKYIFTILALLVFSFSLTTLQAQPRHKHHRDRYEPHYRYRELPHWGYKYRVVPRGAFLLRHAGINYHQQFSVKINSLKIRLLQY